jgi:hypothetical protein
LSTRFDVPDQVAEFVTVVLAMGAQLLFELAYDGYWILEGIFPRLEGQRIRPFTRHGVVFGLNNGRQ